MNRWDVEQVTRCRGLILQRKELEQQLDYYDDHPRYSEEIHELRHEIRLLNESIGMFTTEVRIFANSRTEIPEPDPEPPHPYAGNPMYGLF